MAGRGVRSGLTVGGVLAVLVVGLLAASPASAAASPVVRDISISGTSISAPGKVTLGYTATVDSPVTYAQATYLDARGTTRIVALTMGSSGSGDLQVVDGRPNGTWTLKSLALYSNAGGAVVCRLGDTSAACTERRDLTPYDVVVSGSHEDFDAPLLTSLSVSPSEVVANGVVTVDWATQEAHRTTSVAFTFENTRPEARGARIVLNTSDVAGNSDSFSRRLGSTAYDGPYVLVLARTYDSLGNSATFRPDGTVVPTSPATGPTTHDVDFASVGFTLSGSTQDDAPPVLNSFAATGGPPAVGKPYPVAYSASDASGLRSALFTWTDLNGVSTSMAATGNPPPLTGSLAYTPRSIGTHRLTKVTLTDPYSYSIEYRRDGTTWNALTGERGTHTLDFTKLDLTTRPSAVQVLTARSRPGSAQLTWVVSPDETPGITGYHIVVNPGGRVLDIAPARGDLSSYTVDGLTNATRYTFSVTAQSAFGNGPSRSASTVPLISGNLFGAGDVTGDRRDDLWGHLPTGEGAMRLYRGTNVPGYRGATVAEYLGGDRAFPAAPSGGYAAYLVVESDGRLSTRHVDRNGTMQYGTGSGSGWGGMRFIDGSADLSGDRIADIVAVTQSGQMRVYRGRGNETYAAGTALGTGWQSMTRVFVPGDVTGDRKADVMAVDSAGVLWIYRGNGSGGFSSRVKVSSGWGGLGALFSARDATGDGRGDLGAVTKAGELRIYKGRGNGTFTGATVVGTGWGSFL
ncbi:FG-GAP-like repeat-containing protein [Pedococcus soli]